MPLCLHKIGTILQCYHQDVQIDSVHITSVTIELKFQPSSFRKHPTNVPVSWIPDLLVSTGLLVPTINLALPVEYLRAHDQDRMCFDI